MKKTKKSSGKKTKSGDDLAQMKRDYEAMKRRAEGGGSGSGESVWDQTIVGKNLRRILPRPGETVYYVAAHQHFRVGPEGKATVRCLAHREHFDDAGRPLNTTPCPICKRFLKEQSRINTEFKKGDEEGRTLWRKAREQFCPRTRYMFNVLTPDGDVKIHACGEQIMMQLHTYFMEEDSMVGDFTDLSDGRWMNIKRTGKGAGDRMTKYEVRPGGEPIDITEEWPQIKTMLHDLEKLAGERLTPAQVTAILKGVPMPASRTEEEDEEEEDEEDEEDDY